MSLLCRDGARRAPANELRYDTRVIADASCAPGHQQNNENSTEINATTPPHSYYYYHYYCYCYHCYGCSYPSTRKIDDCCSSCFRVYITTATITSRTTRPFAGWDWEPKEHEGGDKPEAPGELAEGAPGATGQYYLELSVLG